MSQVKVKSFVLEHKMCLTVMILDNSKHCHLEQILFSLELSRYQGLTAFIPGILDKGKFKRKFVLILDTENITDVLEKISWFNLEAFTFENMTISLKAFINLTLFSMGVLCLPKVFPSRLISGGLTIIVYEKLFSLLFFGNYCRGTKSAGWPQTWKIWKTQGI